MFANEALFIAQTITVSISALVALWIGPEALVAFICVACLLANLFITKEITLLGLHATGADAFTIGATVALNLLQEYHGKAITRKTIGINFFLLVLYAVFCKMHLLYIPSSSDSMHIHYDAVLSCMPRIVIASFTVYYIAQLVDCFLYGFLKKKWSQRFLVLRNSLSMAVSQGIDTVLFSVLGLYGVVSHLGEIMIVSYSIKLLAIICIAPFVQFSRTIMRRTH